MPDVDLTDAQDGRGGHRQTDHSDLECHDAGEQENQQVMGN
jgi:hypothetical protein